MKNKFQSAAPGAASPRATYQDILDAPPHLTAELIDGVLYTHPRPVSRHLYAHSRLARKIGTFFDPDDRNASGWWIVNEPELHFGENVVSPDIAGWRRERMPKFPEVSYFTLPPDWVCEMLSDSTREFDLGVKREMYARAGVAYQWFVDPWARSLDAYQLFGTKWVLIDKLFGNSTVSLPPFEAISFSLDVLWVSKTHKDSPRNVNP